MYVPSYFEEKRTEVLHDLISRNPFGILVTYCAEGLARISHQRSDSRAVMHAEPLSADLALR
jgi:predicted FMN-binding regulatory protein PaiB